MYFRFTRECDNFESWMNDKVCTVRILPDLNNYCLVVFGHVSDIHAFIHYTLLK